MGLAARAARAAAIALAILVVEVAVKCRRPASGKARDVAPLGERAVAPLDAVQPDLVGEVHGRAERWTLGAGGAR
jgi:hypothetical protein